MPPIAAECVAEPSYSTFIVLYIFLYGHCHRMGQRPRAAPSPRVYLKPCLMSVLAWVGSCSHFRSPSYQNTTGTGEGHPEFKIAKCHWKGSDETCSCTKRSDRWFLLDQRRSRLHSAAVDRTLSAILYCFLLLFPFLLTY